MRNEARDDQPVKRSRGPLAIIGAIDAFAQGLKIVFRIGRGINQRSKRARAGACRFGRQNIRRIALQPRGIGPDQRAIAAQSPLIGPIKRVHVLAHRRAAQDHKIAQSQPCARRHVDFDAAAQTHAIKQYGFLRQERDARVLPKRQAYIGSGWFAQSAIDFLSRRRREHDVRARLGFDFYFIIIPARHAARDIDEHSVKAPRLFARKAHAQSPFLAHVDAARDAVAHACREKHKPARAD